MEPLLNPAQAAKLLSISPRTLWTLTNSGELPSVRPRPRQVRYAVDDLRAFIAAKRCTAPSLSISA